MSGRRIAGAATLAALVFALAGLLTAALRHPAVPSVAVVVPPEPVREPAPAALPQPQVVVVVTGVGWNAAFAEAALERLPDEVVLALPADLPGAADRLARWQAEGRAVLVRFAWELEEGETAAVPLDADVETQLARLAAQWHGLATAEGAVIVEPPAATALAPAVNQLASQTDKPMLLGSESVAAPPRAMRVDAAVLGERAFATALSAIAERDTGDGTTVVLLELYPALVEPVLDWFDELDAAGLELASVAAVGGGPSP